MKKNRLKGMTLIEIVISMAIYGLLALVTVEIMSTVNMTMKVTNQLNKRLSYESRFADNRQTSDTEGALTGVNSPVYITYGSSADPKTSHDLTSNGDVYTARYTNNNAAVDYTVDTNYQYMVFTPVSAPGIDWSTPFTVNLNVNDDFPFTVKSIELNYDGTTSTITPDGSNTLFTVDVARPAASSANGSASLTATLYRDMSSQTGGTPTKIYDTDGTTFLGWSDNYPFLTVRLDYCTWIKDSEDNITAGNFFRSATFLLQNDGSVISASST